MNNIKEITNTELIIKGYLWVNLPVTVIIIAIWYCLSGFLSLGTIISLFIGTLAGWIYWELTIKKWIKWALDNNVKPDRLLKIGQLSLLLWNSKPIDKVLNENKI